jgi:peptide subunit release factor 1 (eRF1)
MQRLIEEREEVATVRRAMEAGPRGAALGKQPVCDALREGRVMTLVVEDAYREPGTHCPECGGLWAVISPGCLACGGMVEVVQDIAELAIDRALQQRAGLEIVRSGAGQRLMRRTGPMAALLRW